MEYTQKYLMELWQLASFQMRGSWISNVIRDTTCAPAILASTVKMAHGTILYQHVKVRRPVLAKIPTSFSGYFLKGNRFKCQVIYISRYYCLKMQVLDDKTVEWKARWSFIRWLYVHAMMVVWPCQGNKVKRLFNCLSQAELVSAGYGMCFICLLYCKGFEDEAVT